jgi:hypothetical protein
MLYKETEEKNLLNSKRQQGEVRKQVSQVSAVSVGGKELFVRMKLLINFLRL